MFFSSGSKTLRVLTILAVIKEELNLIFFEGEVHRDEIEYPILPVSA